MMPSSPAGDGITPPEETVCVYLMATGKYVKIGIAKDPNWRRSILQGANPLEVSLEMAVAYPSLEKARSVETYLHGVFADFREYGEWFCIPLAWAQNALSQETTSDLWWCDTFPRSRRKMTESERLEIEAAEIGEEEFRFPH